MKAQWLSCLLGLLCMPAEVILSSGKVSQEPKSISQKTVNSSIEITCSTPFSDPMGVHLHRGFHGNKNVVFLDLENGQITKNNIAAEFMGRIHITSDQQIREGCGFTFHLSLLGLEDTDLYYCSWIYYKSEKAEKLTLSSNGTVIIVRERDPKEKCKNHAEDLVFVALSVTAFTAALLVFIGAVTLTCKRFKKHFRPARAVTPSRANRPQPVCLHQRTHHCPYLITSVNTSDFRGIL